MGHFLSFWAGICQNRLVLYANLFRIVKICLYLEIYYYFLQNSVWNVENSKINSLFESMHFSASFSTRNFETSGIGGPRRAIPLTSCWSGRICQPMVPILFAIPLPVFGMHRHTANEDAKLLWRCNEVSLVRMSRKNSPRFRLNKIQQNWN